MDLSKLNRREYYGLYIIIAIVVVCLIGVLLPRNSSSKASAFAKPLFEHAAPSETVVLEKSEDSGKTDGNSYFFACLIVQSNLTEEALTTFYNDIPYAPARENYSVSLTVYPVTGDSVEVVKSSSLYEDGAGDLWYIYLYSSEQ